MAVNTTTNQVYIPGFETNISSVVTPIAYTTTAAVTSLQSAIPGQFSTLTNKIANPATSRDDSEVSPYPLFGIWTNQDNSRKAGYSVINSDFQVVATSRLNNRQGGWTDVDLSGLNNWYEDFRGQTYTNGNPGSNNWSTHSGGGTNMNGHEGNMLYSLQVFGNYGNTQMNRQDQWGQFTSRSGTIIGVRGVRERLNHYSNDSTFQVRLRGSVYGYIDQVNLNSATYATWAGRTNRGMSSYNDRTNMLAVAESTTANAIRLHVWRNTSVSLNGFSHKAGLLHKFLSEAKAAGPTTGNHLSTAKNYAFYDFTWAQAGSTRAEPSYHMKLVMGDNGVIGFGRFNHDGYAQRYGYFTIASQGTAGNSGIGTFTDTEINLGNTTSYGIDQSIDWYGQRHHITWDNEWLAIFSPYHYYSNGINCHTINTYDPTKLFYFRNTDGSNGTAIVPFKEDKFISLYSVQNGDGQGPCLYIVDPGSAAKNLRRTDGTTLSFGGDLQPYNVNHNYQFDTHSNTTQYPHIVSMPHWNNP